MTDLIPFNFDGQAVRVVTIDGEPWFVAADVTALLGYSNGRMAISGIPDRMRNTVTIRDGIRGNPERTVLNEAGVNRLIMRSTLPEAERIQDWLAEDVLPALRRTGSYGVAPALTGPELMAAALIEAQATLTAATARVLELEPKAAYVDTFVADDDLRLLRNVAKSLGVQESALRASLVQHDWIYVECSTRWSDKEQRKVPQVRYSARADKRAYFRPVPAHDAPRFRGEVDHTLKVTPSGATAIAKALVRWGITPKEIAA